MKITPLPSFGADVEDIDTRNMTIEDQKELVDALAEHHVLRIRGQTLDKAEYTAFGRVFGAPIEQPDHAERALRAALQMVGPKLDRFKEWISEAEIADEMRIAAERFQQELGFVPQHFAYPRGIWDARVRDAIAPHCASACTTNGEIATPRNSTRYAIPRVPIRRSDGMRWFEDRVQGRLNGEEQLVRMAKRALGRNVGY